MAEPPFEIRTVTTSTSGSVDGLIHLADSRRLDGLHRASFREETAIHSLCGVTLRDWGVGGWNLGYWRWPESTDALAANCPACRAELARRALEQAHG